MFDGKNVNNYNSRKLVKKIFIFWIDKSESISILLFMIIFLLIVGWIFKNIYYYSWTENQKREYINKKYQQIQFQENKFNSIIDSLQKRQQSTM